jgi:hypothetical protein
MEQNESKNEGTLTTVDDLGHDLSWHKQHCGVCFEAAAGQWLWCPKAEKLAGSGSTKVVENLLDGR